MKIQNDSRILALLRKQGYCFVSDDDSVFAIENAAINHKKKSGHQYTRYPEKQLDIPELLLEFQNL